MRLRARRRVCALLSAALGLAGCPGERGTRELETAGAADAPTNELAAEASGAQLEVGPGWDPDNWGVVEDEGDPGCEGLDPTHCLFPFPSDRFRAGDPPALAFGAALPKDVDGQPLDPTWYAEHDGFSTATPIIFGLGGPVDLGKAPGVATLDRSLELWTQTLVLEADTLTRVPHYAELDHFGLEAGLSVVILRPARALRFGTRHLVAVRGLLRPDGAAIAPPSGFAALRDRLPSRVMGVHARRAHFEDEVFPVLAQAGFARDEIILSFDFTTASEANATGLMLAMRDGMLSAIGADGPAYQITSVTDPGHPNIARLVEGVAQVPSSLAPAVDGIRRVRRDAHGAPVVEGTESVIFEIQIPPSVLATPGKAAVVQYGHGLFGGRAEAHNTWLREMADRLGCVILACDLQGMSEADQVRFAEVLVSSFGRFPLLTEEPMQGVLNHLALVRMLKGRVAANPDEAFLQGGALVFDPTRVYYYGNSQGGTFGALIASLSTDVERSVLGVPGGGFAYLLHKSTGFQPFAGLLATVFPDPLDFMALFGPVQTAFDRIEPLSYVRRASVDPFPGTPAHRLLFHIAKEDSVVPNEISHLVARTAGARLLQPAVRPIWGLESAASPFAGTTAAEYDFGHPPNPAPWYPPPLESDTHEDLRRLVVAQDQLMSFLETGQATHLCSGVCDPD